MGGDRSSNHLLKNIGLEIENVFAFLAAAVKFWDKRMQMIVRGTLLRQVKVAFNKRKTLQYIEHHRKGNCSGCGFCCQYIRRCPYLTSENLCSINDNKHFICRVYPVSDYDVKLVSKVSDKKCGYYFDDGKE
ncbi:MAG TPA: hypothetical protein DCZ51_11030 [Bacteroidales bacterium]|nr:hypothetical protein [Bacteroidales bacterium]